jgi:hypothetical protein
MLTLNLAQVVSNMDNARDTVGNLRFKGYGVVEPLPGIAKHSLFGLALGTPEQKKTYLELIDTNEEYLVGLAASIKKRGQIVSVEVRQVEKGYALVIGCCRCLAVLYNHAAYGDPATVEAKLFTGDSFQAYLRSVDENKYHLKTNLMDDARQCQFLKDHGKTDKEIAEDLGVTPGTVKNRLDLLHLDADNQNKVRLGKLSQQEALFIVHPDRTKPTKKTNTTTPKSADDGVNKATASASHNGHAPTISTCFASVGSGRTLRSG